jgi:hypothetical protein
VNFSALPALLSHSGGHEENRQSLISARRRFFCTCGRTIPIANAGPRHEIVLMSFVETLDNLALKKSEVVQRFGQLIAPKSGVDEVVAEAQHLTRQGFRQIFSLQSSIQSL